MTPTEREQSLAELIHEWKSTPCGDSLAKFIHDKMINRIIAEHDKARNQAIQDCIDILRITPGDENVIPKSS